MEIDTYARDSQSDEGAVEAAHHDDVLSLSLEEELGPLSFALPVSDAVEDWPAGLLLKRRSLFNQALDYMEREVTDGLPLTPKQQRRLQSLAGVSSTALSDALMAPEIARYLTRSMLAQLEEDGWDDGTGDVFAVTAVLPDEGYGLQPGDGPEEWTATATCLLTCGHRAFGVLEVWPSYAEAKRRCLEILDEAPQFSMPLLVRALRFGQRVQWRDPVGDV